MAKKKKKKYNANKLLELLKNVKGRTPFARPQRPFLSQKIYKRNKNKDLIKKEQDDG